MPDLSELQRMMREAVLEGDVSPDLGKAIVSDALSAEKRFQVYQNNYRVSLVDLLTEIYPVASAFVGNVFLRAALREFVLDTGPKQACLNRYGDGFSSFLKTFEHVQDIPYLSDIASLEWSIYSLQHVDEERPTESVNGLKFNKNTVYIESDYPLINLWMVGTGRMLPEAVRIDQGGQTVAVVLFAGEIELFSLTEAEKAFVMKGVPNLDDDACSRLKEKNIIL